MLILECVEQKKECRGQKKWGGLLPFPVLGCNIAVVSRHEGLWCARQARLRAGLRTPSSARAGVLRKAYRDMCSPNFPTRLPRTKLKSLATMPKKLVETK